MFNVKIVLQNGTEKTIPGIIEIDRIPVGRKNDPDSTGITGGPGYIVVLHTQNKDFPQQHDLSRYAINLGTEPIHYYTEDMNSEEANSDDESIAIPMIELELAECHTMYVMNQGNGNTLDTFPNSKERTQRGDFDKA